METDQEEFFEEEWNCGLLSVVDALMVMGSKVSYSQIFNEFRDHGFNLQLFGISTIHVGLLIQLKQYDVTILTHTKWLKKIWEARNIPFSKLQGPVESLDTIRALNQFIDSGGKIQFIPKNNKPDISDIYNTVREGTIVIACVNAFNYYGINEEWNHYVVINKIKTKTKQLNIIDSLKDLGNQQYLEWDSFYQKSLKYDWKKWSGDLIIINKRIINND